MAGLYLDELVDAPGVYGESAAAEEDVVDGEAAKKAMEPAIVAALERLATDMLQEETRILGGYTIRSGRGPYVRCMGLEQSMRQDLPGVKCLHTAIELVQLAKPILVERMKRQKEYLRKCVISPVGRGQTSPFNRTSQRDQAYREWLDAGDVSAPVPSRWQEVILLQPLLINSKEHVVSAYNIDCSTPSRALGAVLAEDITLRWICELGDRFSINPEFYLEHSMEYRAANKTPIGIQLRADGVLHNYVESYVKLPEDMYSLLGWPLDGHVRLSCLNLQDALFIVLCKDAEQPLANLPAGPRMAVAKNERSGSVSVLHAPVEFFSDAWNVRRLVKLLRHTREPERHQKFDRDRLLHRLFVLSHLHRSLNFLAAETQALDYELVEPVSSTDALDRVKSCRARVARVRSSNAKLDQWSTHWLHDTYKKALQAQAGNHAEAAESEGDLSASLDATPRQLASVSVQSEYAWIEKRAADLMPLLNQTLQLIIAQSAVRDSAISVKNGERSTQLTLLAAIYLPLTLATGIFGMNIKDIDGDAVRFWWVVIVWIVLMIPSGVVVAYIFWKSRKDAQAQAQRDKGDKLA